jgi:hypothetical protein
LDRPIDGADCWSAEKEGEREREEREERFAKQIALLFLSLSLSLSRSLITLPSPSSPHNLTSLFLVLSSTSYSLVTRLREDVRKLVRRKLLQQGRQDLATSADPDITRQAVAAIMHDSE